MIDNELLDKYKLENFSLASSAKKILLINLFWIRKAITPTHVIISMSLSSLTKRSGQRPIVNEKYAVIECAYICKRTESKVHQN